MTARIRGLEEAEAPLLVKPLYASYRKIVGRVATPLKIQARRPLIAWFGNLFGLMIEKSGKVDKRLHVLIQLRAAQTVECPFCIDLIPALGRKQNLVSDEELREVSNWERSQILSARERCAIEYAEEMSKTPVRVSDDLFGRLKNYFDDDQIVELTASIAYENYRARFSHALHIGSENFYGQERQQDI